MENKITDRIIDEAENWHEIFADDRGTYQQRLDFTRWYEESGVHQKAYAQVAFADDMGIDFTAMSVVKAVAPPTIAVAESPNFLYRLVFPMGLGAALATLVLLVVFMGGQSQQQQYATQVGEVRVISLADGSEVSLGAASSIRVDHFSDGERRVYLDKGEALFSVHKDPARPFIVTSGDTSVRVLGTRFNMNKADESLRVSLLEGRVRVVQEKAWGILPFLNESIEISPAHSVSVHAGVIQPVKTRRIKNMATWVDGQLTYKATPLLQVLSDLRRYSGVRLTMANPEIGDMPLTATFSTDHAENIIENLPYILALKVRKTPSGSYILEKK